MVRVTTAMEMTQWIAMLGASHLRFEGDRSAHDTTKAYVTGSESRSNRSEPTTSIAAGDLNTSRLCAWKFWKKPDAQRRICFV